MFTKLSERSEPVDLFQKSYVKKGSHGHGTLLFIFLWINPRLLIYKSIFPKSSQRTRGTTQGEENITARRGTAHRFEYFLFALNGICVKFAMGSEVLCGFMYLEFSRQTQFEYRIWGGGRILRIVSGQSVSSDEHNSPQENNSTDILYAPFKFEKD